MKGSIRITRAGDIFACNVWDLTVQSVYGIISFMRRRNLVTDEYIIIEIQHNHTTMEFYSFKEICQYFNINLN
jgi:hypothetical protein